MSGEGNERPSPGQPTQSSTSAADTSRAHDEPLLSAYLDGVSELTVAERRRVEASLEATPTLREESAATRALIDRLRGLTPEGREPDWGLLERSIHQAVGPTVPRPWWRTWWLALPGALAAATAALLVTWAPTKAVEVAPRVPEVHTGGKPSVPAPSDAEDTLALWLDGAVVDVDLAATDGFAGDEVGTDETASDEVALLPATDLGWIDGLDEDDIERAERWLAKEKS